MRGDLAGFLGAGDRHIAATVLRPEAPPCLIVVNKVDLMRPKAIAETIAAAAELGDFHAIHPISARTGVGVDELAADLAALMPEGPAYFPEGVSTDQTREQRIGEAIREAALEALRQEVPHAVAVLIEEIARGRKGVTVVQATIICETQSQKRILVGAGGAMIRRIGTAEKRVAGRTAGR